MQETQHTDSIHAFKLADKIARQEGHRQVLVEYLNEIAHNSRDASFLSDEDFTEAAFATIQSPEKKFFIDQLALNHCLGSAEILVLNNCQAYFYSVLETNSSTIQPSAGHKNFIQANLYSTHYNIIFKYLKSSLKKNINDNKPFSPQIKSLNH